MRLWVRFSQTLQELQEGIGDVLELMRLREVLTDLISDYWTTAKETIRRQNSWNQLTPEEQAIKKAKWIKELEKEQNQLLNELNQREQTLEEQKKEQVREKQRQSWLNEEKIKSKGVICPECQELVPKLDKENGMCSDCLDSYEDY